MKTLIPVYCYLLFSAMGAQAATDAVTDCRAQHADNPTAHIACLEAALNDHPANTAAESSAAESSTDFGSEQVEQKKRASGELDERPVIVNIVAVRYSTQGLGLFKLDNGQTWRETEGAPRHMRLDPAEQYRAVLQRGTVGGYRLYVDGIRRMLKVERLK